MLNAAALSPFLRDVHWLSIVSAYYWSKNINFLTQSSIMKELYLPAVIPGYAVVCVIQVVEPLCPTWLYADAVRTLVFQLKFLKEHSR